MNYKNLGPNGLPDTFAHLLLGMVVPPESAWKVTEKAKHVEENHAKTHDSCDQIARICSRVWISSERSSGFEVLG